MPKKHIVDFYARKPVKEPVRVSFPTKKGPVSFDAHEVVKEKVEVRFKAKDKQ
jgi:hypothetical protein